MKLKKIMALGLAATMVVSSSVVALADETVSPASGTTTGSGKLEGTVDTDVFNVVLPTTSAETLKFILDPEGLIKATSNKAYDSATFGEGTLFFQKDTNDYQNESATLTITNKSAVDVDVKLTAQITDADGITLSSDKAFTEDTSASMYMAVKYDSSEDAITDDGVTIEKTIAKAPEGAYEYKYNSGSGYSYGLIDDLSQITFNKMDFSLTGASNAKGDWSALSVVAPNVKVTYEVSKHVETAAPSIATTTYELTAETPVVVSVDLGKGDKAATGIASVIWNGVNLLGDTISYDDSTGKITIGLACVSYWISNPDAPRTVTVTFNDTASTTVELTMSYSE
ncbi:MAG: hypothetical protein PUD13_07940 [Lachnospira sp.]|nr:hypothetical protein [Lachnospira sp.]